jgi:hypothetical protein
MMSHHDSRFCLSQRLISENHASQLKTFSTKSVTSGHLRIAINGNSERPPCGGSPTREAPVQKAEAEFQEARTVAVAKLFGADSKRIPAAVRAELLKALIMLAPTRAFGRRAGSVLADEIEDSEAVLVADDGFAIDQAGPRGQSRNRHGNEGKAAGEVVSFARDQAHASSVPARYEPEAVMLDFVNPPRAGRRQLGRGRKARFDKADRAAATHYH